MKKGKHSVYGRYKRKNLMARLKPWIIAALCLVFAAAAALAVYCFFFTEEETEETVYESMSESSLPVLTMEYEGRQINLLYGYTAEMDLDYACESIYLLENTYEIPVEITLNGNKASSVDFFLYDTENSSLIQNGTASGLETSGDVLEAVLTIDQVISNDAEYVLDIVLTLKSGQEVHYYTRLIRSADTPVSDQIELAFSFMEATLSGDEDFLTSYMNTNPWTQTNTNFSGVNLKSSISQMMWKNMEVSLYGEASLTILDIYGYISCFRIDYTVTRTDGDETEYYRVSEFYRIRMSSDLTRILSYERTVDEIFMPTEDSLSESAVELGILSSEDVETAASDDGSLSCFAAGGSLWCMDSSDKTLTRIFSFESYDADSLASANTAHDIEIISVDDSGDIEFLVYGYMSAGLHEGLSGVGLYRYDAQEDKVTELLFIESDVPYEVLKETTGEMLYANENGTLYILIDTKLYSVDLETCGLTVLAENLTEGSFKVSLSGSVIAWQEDGSVNDAGIITALDGESETLLKIYADDGCAVKILGFIGTDVVYGQGTAGDYGYDEYNEECLLMDTVCVVSINGSKESENVSDSGYFLSAQSEYNRIIITKTTGDEFTLFSSEITAAETPEIYSSYDETKEYVYYLSFIDSTTTAGDFIIDTETEAELTDDCVVSPTGFLDLSGRYIVYGKGHIQLITSSASEAVTTAYEAEGCVRTEGGEYFYRRGIVPSSVTFTDNNIENAINAYTSGEVVNVTGITRTQALYFLGESIAVYWEYDDTVYLIYGYDTSENLRLYDIETGQTSTMAGADADEVFETEGSVYVKDNS